MICAGCKRPSVAYVAALERLLRRFGPSGAIGTHTIFYMTYSFLPNVRRRVFAPEAR